MGRLLRLLCVRRPIYQTLGWSLTTGDLTILMKTCTGTSFWYQSVHNILIVFNSSELFEGWSRGLALVQIIGNYSENWLSRLSFGFVSASAFGGHALVALVEVAHSLLLYSTSWSSTDNSRFLKTHHIRLLRSNRTPLFLSKMGLIALSWYRVAFKRHLGFVSSHISTFSSLRKHNSLTVLLLVKVVWTLCQSTQFRQADIHTWQCLAVYHCWFLDLSWFRVYLFL